MKCQPLFTLRITHSYYADGRCADFLVEPDAATRRLLANHRCLLRPLADGLQVTTAVNAQGVPMLALAPGATLRFHLRLANPDFRLFTEPGALADNPAPVFTDVGASPPRPVTQLVVRARTEVRTDRFVFPPDTTQAQFALSGRPRAAAAIAEFKLDGLSGGSVAKAGPGPDVTVTAARSAVGRPFAATYPVQPRLAAGVFADVEIHRPAAAVAPPAEYAIAFTARAARWRYYVATDRDPPGGGVSIDAGARATFTQSAIEAADPVGAALQGEYADRGVRVDCFTSVAPLPCSPMAPTDLKLKIGIAAAVEVLPAPPLRNVCTIDRQPGFFHIVRKITKH